MQQLLHTYAWSQDRSYFTLEQLHLAALPHFLQGGGNGALLGQLSLGYLNSSPGLYSGRVTMDTSSFTIEVVTVLLIDDDIDLVSSLSSMGNDILKDLLRVSPRICSGFWEFLCW